MGNLDRSRKTRSLRPLLGAPLILWVLGASPLLAEEPPLSPGHGGEVEALIKEALEKNPDLAEAREEAEAARQRIRPAGALPDPTLSISYQNDGSAPSLGTQEMTFLQFMAQQTLPFPGKLRLASEVAKADASRVDTRTDRVRLTIEASVRRAYADLLAARENLQLVAEQRLTFRDMEAVTRARYTAGMGTEQDVLRAQSEETRLLQQRQRDEAGERTAVARLDALLFRPAGTPIPTTQRLVPGELSGPPPEKAALKKALEETPELKAAALAKERSRLSANLARRNLAPDFIASAGYMNRGGLPLMWSAGVGVSVPLWAGRKQRPLIAEAESLATAAAASEQSLRRRIEERAEERLVRLEQLREEARLDAGGVLVQDRLSVEAALASYKTGNVPFVTVLEALGTLFSDRRAAVERLAGLIRAEADLYEFSLDEAGSMTPAPFSPVAGM